MCKALAGFDKSAELCHRLGRSGCAIGAEPQAGAGAAAKSPLGPAEH